MNTEEESFVGHLQDSAAAAIRVADPSVSLVASRRYGKAATVAVLRGLSDEVAKAETDDNDLWPDSDDLQLLADELEES